MPRPAPARRASGAPLAWQIATASASAAWSGFGSSGEREQRLDHPLDLLLAGAAGAADRGLDLLGRVGGAADGALAGGEDHDAARLADGERRARVGAEVEVLDRDRVGLVARPSARRRGAWIVRQPRARRPAPAGVSITPPSSATSRPRSCATMP